jgi:hypothetical protein
MSGIQQVRISTYFEAKKVKYSHRKEYFLQFLIVSHVKSADSLRCETSK